MGMRSFALLTAAALLASCADSVAVRSATKNHPAPIERSTKRQTSHTNENDKAPEIITRAQWAAKAPIGEMRTQTVRGIIIHHTGVRKNASKTIEEKMRGLQAFSQSPGQVSPGKSKPSWPDVPYHFYIDSKGNIAEGRDTRFAGDTNTGYDTVGYIQIVVEGDFEHEKVAAEQTEALRATLKWLIERWGLPPSTITYHKMHARTDCPGHNLIPEIESLVREMT